MMNATRCSLLPRRVARQPDGAIEVDAAGEAGAAHRVGVAAEVLLRHGCRRRLDDQTTLQTTGRPGTDREGGG